jgi:hypothetical protein
MALGRHYADIGSQRAVRNVELIGLNTPHFIAGPSQPVIHRHLQRHRRHRNFSSEASRQGLKGGLVI